MRRVLLITFQFPPFGGSSAVQRMLSFTRFLPQFGWQPVVLTVDPDVYERQDPNLLSAVPANTPVYRTRSLDTARHLAIARRYPTWLATPDRWWTWRLSAVKRGVELIREHKIDAILSTYPIATAHDIAHRIAVKTGVPWLADFRDPMAHDGYPADPTIWRSFKQLEERIFARAHTCIFVTDPAAAMYRDRYPQSPAHVDVVENGFDPTLLAGAVSDQGAPSAQRQPLTPGRLTLLHSGVVYPIERDPTALIAALKALPKASRDRLMVRFRAPNDEAWMKGLIDAAGIRDCAEVLGSIPYQQALAEMAQADALLLLQAASCNEQIPAKVYEYAYIDRPIVGLCCPLGATADRLRKFGDIAQCPLDDAQAIGDLLQRLPQIVQKSGIDRDAVLQTTREVLSGKLAGLLDRAAASRA